MTNDTVLFWLVWVSVGYAGAGMDEPLMIFTLIALALLLPLTYKVAHARGFHQGVLAYWLYKDTDRKEELH